MAGLGEVCSHVGAILFYIEALRCAKTCTDVTCQWVVPTSVKSIPYAKISEIDFTRPKSKILPIKRAAHYNNDCDMLSDETDIENPSSSCHGDSSTIPITYSSGTVNANLTEPNKDQIDAFFNSISKHKSCCLSLVSPYSNEFVPKFQKVTALLPPPLTSLYSAQNEELTYNELMNCCERVTITLNREEILEIEKATRDQSHCDAWYAQRSGRITASKMKLACRTDPASPSVSLIDQICYPAKHKFSTEATRWGLDSEETARAAYTEQMEMYHVNFNCFCCGLLISEQCNFIAATPDGVVSCDCCGSGILEIKCPFVTKDDDPDLARFLENGSLPKDHQYYYQVQTQLFVGGAEFADFVVCTFPNNIPTLSVERITVDKEFVDACIEQASQFFKVAILPELLGRWYSRSLVIPVKMNSGTASYDYCYCKEELGGEMICCENSNCNSGQWFHLSCLKIKIAPRVKKWYCPTCRCQEEFKPPKRKKQKQH